MLSILPQSLLDWIQERVSKESQVLDWAAIPLVAQLPGKTNLLEWIAAGNHAQMEWMSKSITARLDPKQLLPEAKSIVLFLWKYPQSLRRQNQVDHCQIAAYAQGEDYHLSAGKWLALLIHDLSCHFPQAHARLFVDTLPIQERAWAAEARLGWIGKNSLLIHPKHGSAFCIAGFLISEDIKKLGDMPDGKEFCGSCRKCLDACPSQAILGNRTVDSRLCASFLTIEKRGEFSSREKTFIENRLFGCDICQVCCPWNGKHLKDDAPYWPTTEADWEFLLAPGNGLRSRLRGTPLDRVGRKGLSRNFSAQKKDSDKSES